MKIRGFTLAEVLITLGIIGVVAAMTIPTLVSKYQNQEYVAKLKKFTSTFSQAMKNLSNDYGCSNDLNCTGLFINHNGNAPKVIAQGDSIAKYFNVSKNCQADWGLNCFAVNTYKSLKGSSLSPGPGNNGGPYSFVTADGMAIALYVQNCADLWLTNNQPTCGNVELDINGPKPPNVLGRDAFMFFIGNDGSLVATGTHKFANAVFNWDNSSSNNYRCNPPQDSLGWGCAGRIIEEGWEMNY